MIETLWDKYDLSVDTNWYRDMFIKCADIALVSDQSLHTTIGVVAATSPRVSLHSNLLMAERALSHGDVRCLFANKVHALIDGEAWEDVLGMKTLDFAYAIQTKGDHDRAPMDIWAARAAGITGLWAPSRKQYETLLDEYKAIAADVDRPVAMVQADIWCFERGAKW